VDLGVVPYDEAWPQIFEAIRRRIDAALGGVPHVTEHVGSTAVPGLVAKPIIDVAVVVPAATNVSDAVRALASIGYEHEGDLGVTGRAAFRAPPGTTPHHLYVVVAGSKPQLDHVRFRDFLRGHPDHAQRYAARKLEFAPLLETDRQAYVDGKADIITEMLTLAAAGVPPSRTVEPDRGGC